MRVRYFTDGDRFWSRVQRAEPAECWLWTGGKKAAGYGNMAVKRPDGSWTQTPAHRWVYEAMVGPIPAEHEVDHVCGVRACVNPCHLEAVSVQENRRRRDEGYPMRLTREPVPMPEVGEPKPVADRGPKPPPTHCRNGHEYAAVGRVKNGRVRTCAACRAASAAKRRKGGQHGTETHCPHGHPYVEGNIYYRRRPDGTVKSRECRTCVLARNRARR